jgi:hypothetical protein
LLVDDVHSLFPGQLYQGRTEQADHPIVFEQKELSARQIEEIKIQAVCGRYGQITSILTLFLPKGKNMH